MLRKNPLIVQKCPVCRAVLGERNSSVLFIAKCFECKAFYSWEPGKDKPKATFHDPEKGICGCGNCSR